MFTVKFDALLSRADDQTLQALLGDTGMRLIMLLDPKLSTPTKLKEIIVGLHTLEGLLLSREARTLLVDLLRPAEAKKLADLLKLDTTNIYHALQELRLSRGSTREQLLLDRRAHV